jgi:DNA modification methylase
MMQSVFSAIPATEKTQIIVNLGLIYRKNEWIEYWHDWMDWMRTNGWRKFGMYIWDKTSGMPGDFKGRLAPCFEFVFHFNKASRTPNKTKAKLARSIGSKNHHAVWRNSKTGTKKELSSPLATFNTHKIPDSVFRFRPSHFGKANRYGDHPATFPIELPMEYIAAYTAEKEIVFDPFLGSGTTILAADRLNRIGYGIELCPQYCDYAIDRLQRETKRLAYRQDGECFDALAEPEFFASCREALSAHVV